MSIFKHKSHNVTVLMYHIVCPAKYRKFVFSKRVDDLLRDICLEISDRYEIYFLEIGVDGDHVHFLIQSVPMYSPTKIVRTIKSITAREIFQRAPEVKKKLWGGEFWSKGFFMSTVGKHGDEAKIADYVKNQGVSKDYKKLYSGSVPKIQPGQMTLFGE
jgi:putative transposase